MFGFASSFLICLEYNFLVRKLLSQLDKPPVLLELYFHGGPALFYLVSRFLFLHVPILQDVGLSSGTIYLDIRDIFDAGWVYNHEATRYRGY